MQKVSFKEHFSITVFSGINLLILVFSSVEIGKTTDEEFVKLAVGKTISAVIFLIPVTESFLKICNNFKDQWICNEI